LFYVFPIYRKSGTAALSYFTSARYRFDKVHIPCAGYRDFSGAAMHCQVVGILLFPARQHTFTFERFTRNDWWQRTKPKDRNCCSFQRRRSIRGLLQKGWLEEAERLTL